LKVAITAQGEDLESKVDQRFGRCSRFIVIDTETGDYQVVSNEQNLNASQGAGIQSAGNVNRFGVEAVITGYCGPKAFRTLRSAGIKVFCCTEGTVAGALEKFKRGELNEAKEANVESHWV